METMNTYTYDEVYAACLDYFNGDELAASVMVTKYLLRDTEGNFLEKTPEDMHVRISKEYARIESKYPNSIPYEDIHEALSNFNVIVPQGSPMFGIGNDIQTVSIANCYVVGQPVDSYGGILQKDQQLAQIMKRRGGVGIDISTLRPSGALVNNSARTSDGITCFMERYSNTTKEVAQNGRRGALMISLDCRHPDLDKFIDIKVNQEKVTGANISVKWHDDFLQAVENDDEYVLRFPVDASIEDAETTRVVQAKEIWDKFVQANWASAEPGCLFWDTIIGQSISDCYSDLGFETISTNPCGEITLSEYGACILQVLKLTAFVKNAFQSDAYFDWEMFERYVRMNTRLTDDMIDIELEKNQQTIDKVRKDPEKADIKRVELELWKNIQRTYEEGRRVGMGITALGDMLAMLGIRYGSDDALEMIDQVFSKMQATVYDESAELAKERGPFPIWDWNREKDSHYIKILPQATQDKIKKYGRRNIAGLTCAPTGSLSIECQVSSGIEPIFKRSYQRWRKLTQDDIAAGIKPDRVDSDGIPWTSYEVFHHALEQWRELHPNKNPEESPYKMAEAGELDWKTRVLTQATIQKYIDHSISSTCNVPADITVEEVSELYLEGWRSKCKGITIYRDGSRIGVLTSADDKDDDDSGIKDSHAPKRPDILECEIHYSNVESTPWVFFVGMMDGRPYDIFGGRRTNIEIPRKYKGGWIKKNGRKSGRRTYDLYLGSLEDEDERILIKDIASEFSPDSGSYTRIISMSMRHGVPMKFIVEQLKKDHREASMYSFEKVVARILKKYVEDGEKSGDGCEECGDKLIYQDGCVICKSCGNGKCD
jgi:ribonucleoside-diphosphate reductase alpha chain